MSFLQQTLVDMRYLTFKTQMNFYNQIKQYMTNIILTRFIEYLSSPTISAKLPCKIIILTKLKAEISITQLHWTVFNAC